MAEAAKTTTTRKPRTATKGTTPDTVVLDEAQTTAEEPRVEESTPEPAPETYVPENTLERAFLGAVQLELETVFEKYGEQNRPHLYNGLDEITYAAREKEYKRRYAMQEALGTIGWDTIVLEEAFEAFAEPDPELAYGELVQLAAMATLAATSLKRRAESL